MHSRYRISGQIDLTVSLPGYPILGFFQKLLNFDTPAYVYLRDFWGWNPYKCLYD